MITRIDGKRYVIELEGRIDAANADEAGKELLELAADCGERRLQLDAEKLEYISSAGLRALMKLRRISNEPVTVVNVSKEIYDIFETTGFTELLKVYKKPRRVEVEGCPVIGQGGNGTIYRLDDDTIVKVYQPWMTMEEISHEREYARTAFVNGIPSVIAYDVVQCGDCLGLVFELIKSSTLGSVMRDNPDRLEEYTDKYVELAKTLHGTHITNGGFERIQNVYHRWTSNLGEWCSEEEMSLLHSIIDEIPETDTVTHNDLHPGNIMLQGDELVLIDMPAVTLGPPVCDLIAIYRDLIAAPSGQEYARIERSTGMKKEMLLRVGDLFFSKYTGIADPAGLQEYYKKLGLLYAFNVSMVSGSGSAGARKLAPIIMDELLRKIVIPNEQAVRALFKTL